MSSKLTKDQLIATIAAHPGYVATPETTPLDALTKADLGKILQALPAQAEPEVKQEEEQIKTEETGPTLPLGYIVVKDEASGRFELCFPNGDWFDGDWFDGDFETRDQAVAQACMHEKAYWSQKQFVANGGQTKAQSTKAASVDKGPTAKEKSYKLFADNASLSSSELLNLVCKELGMDRKVASSYLCYYRKDNNIVANRGLSKEEKLKNYINEHFATELSEGQMTAILATINEE